MTRIFSLPLVAIVACVAISAQGPPARDQVQNFNSRFGRNAALRGPVIHDPFMPPVTAAKIRSAIDDAVYYLRAQQGPDGSVHGDEGSTSLTALTLLAAGADPAADDGL